MEKVFADLARRLMLFPVEHPGRSACEMSQIEAALEATEGVLRCPLYLELSVYGDPHPRVGAEDHDPV